MHSRATRQPRMLRDRLRMASFAVTLLIVTFVAGLHLAGPATSPFNHLIGSDFVPSYMAGSFVREGRFELLTNFAAATDFQTKLQEEANLERHGRVGPWLNPPFFAAMFVPLSALPYRAALGTWFTLNLCMLAASLLLLYRMLPEDRRRPADGVVIGALVLVSMPCLQAMACQQNTFLSLLILCAAVTLARKDKPFAAGAIAALLLFKPQLAVIACGAIVCILGRRAFIGMVTTSVLLLLATLVYMPGTISDYLHKLPGLLPYLRTDQPYFWERQTTFLGFWRLLLGGRTGGPNPPAVTLLWLIGAATVAVSLAVPLWQVLRRGTNPLTRDRLLATTIAAAPLLMPYYMDYDLLLLAVPAVLLAAERMQTGRRVGDRRLIAMWAVIYAWLYFNAAVGDATGVSVIVLLLAIRFMMPARPWWPTGEAVDLSACEDHRIHESGVLARSASRQYHSASLSPALAGKRPRISSGVLLPLLSATLAVLVAVVAGLPNKSSSLTFGHDLLPGYVAGQLVLEGRAKELYSVDATRLVGHAVIADQNLTSEPSHVLWLNPPHFALLFAPLAALPYRVALLVWLGLNVALATAALATLYCWILHRRQAFWLGVAALTSCPFVLVVEHQQSTFLSLAILTAVVAAWRSRRPLLAGVILGMLAYKPQLAIAVGVVLIVREGRWALAGLAIMGAITLAVGELMASGSTLAFLTQSPAHAALFQHSPGYNWGRQMTPTAFFRTLLGPQSGWATALGPIISVTILAAVVWTSRRCSRDMAIALAVSALPLCAPYYMDYDLFLLLVPAALLLKAGRVRLVVAAGMALWLLTWLNVEVVAATGVNMVVLLLIALAVVLLRIAVQIEDFVSSNDFPAQDPLPFQPDCPWNHLARLRRSTPPPSNTCKDSPSRRARWRTATGKPSQSHLPAANFNPSLRPR